MSLLEVLLTVLCGVLIVWIIASPKQKYSQQSSQNETAQVSSLLLEQTSTQDQKPSLDTSSLQSGGETAERLKPSSSPVVYRVRGPFSSSELPELLVKCLGPDCKPHIHSFANQADSKESVVTVSFECTPDALSNADERTFHSENITIDSHFRGLTVLFDPDSHSHETDIIAICGLGGHALGSFKERNGTHIWLRDTLKDDFPHARVMTYGYDSHIYRSNSFQNFESLASALRVTVEGITPPSIALRLKPIIFIAHSLGGLVLKEALIQSGQIKSNLFRRTRGALFFGVPNLGINISSLLPMAEGQVNEGFLHNLHPESELLRRQSQAFQDVFDSPKTTIFCLYEQKTSPTAQKVDGKWKMSGPEAILVGSHSATHCRHWENRAHHVQGLNRNHSELVKFRMWDEDYTKTRNLLRQIITRQNGSLPQRSAVSTAEEKLTNSCLQELLLTNPHNDMLRIEMTKDKLLKDCYQWIMSDPQLCEWRTDPSRRLLWLRGDPGKGKTMLMISLVRELQPAWNDAHVLTFFFCQNSDAKLNTATAVLRGLLWALIHEYPCLGSYLHADFQHGGKQSFEGANAFFTLHRIMTKMLLDETLPTVYILIDALDECETGRHDLLKLICGNASDARSKAKWLVSSRNYLDIEELLGNHQYQYCMLSLELNETHIAKAVSFFIQHRTKELAQRKKYNQRLQMLVEKHLTEKADSTFLWVALVCKRLETVQTYQTKTELKTIPQGLPSLYDRMLGHLLKEDGAKLTTAILRLLVLAKRPLLIDELHTLTDLPEELLDEKESLLDLIKSCGSFATVREGTIYLIHQSVKDYFVGGTGQQIFTFGISQEHREIVDRSLSLLSTKLKKNICALDGPGAPANRNHPLLNDLGYVCCFWVDHLADYENARIDGTDKDLLADQGKVHRFLLRYFLNWIELLALLGQLRAGITLLRLLEAVAKKYAGTSLYSFVHDAVRLLLQCHLAVEQAPLQIYASGLIFAPEESVVREAFAQDIPHWIYPLPRVPKNWSPLRQTLEGHTSLVCSVAFNFNGQQLASGSGDHTVRIWDAVTGAVLQTLEGHTGPVTSVAFQTGSKQLASGSADHTIRLWDTVTGTVQQIFSGHTDWVNSVAFNPDGRQLASGSDDCIVRLWDATTGALLQKFEGHTSSVDSVTFSRDSKQLASGSADHTIRLWDTVTGTVQQILEGHTDWIKAVAYSPNGRQLASGSKDRTMRLWNIATGRILQIFESHGDSVWSVAFSPDGTQIASGSEDHTIRLWDATTGTLQQILRAHTGMVRSVAFSPDSQQLVSGSWDATVRLWDTATMELQQTLVGHMDFIHSLAFSPDGQQLASASEDRTIRVWDGLTGVPQRTLEGHRGGVRSVAFSPDNRQLTSGSDDCTICLWDIRNGVVQQTLEGHTGDVRSVAFSPDSKQLASASYDGTIRLWDVATRVLRQTINLHTTFDVVKFSPNGQQLASGSNDCTVRLWHTATGVLQKTLEGHRGGVRSVAFSPDGRQLASGSYDTTVRLWDAATGLLQHTLNGHTSSVYSVAFSPDGRRLASGSGDNTICFWDTRNGTLQQTLKGHTSKVWSVAFSPDGKQLVSGSHDKTIYLWDIANGVLQQLFEGHTAGIMSVAFSPNGRQLASCSYDFTVRLWDIQTMALQKTLAGHKNAVISVAFSPDGRQLASGGWADNTVRLWDAATGELLQTFEGHARSVRSVAFSPNGRQLASGSDDCTVRLWDTATMTLRQSLEGHTERIWSVAFSPDSQQLAVGSAAGTVHLWDTMTGEVLQTFEGHADPVRSIAFSPDRRQLASRSYKIVRLWDAATRALQQTLDDTSPHQSLYFAFNDPELSDLTALSIGEESSWIKWKGKRLIWLPQVFRPGETAFRRNGIAIGCSSGLVYIVGFTAGDFLIN